MLLKPKKTKQVQLIAEWPEAADVDKDGGRLWLMFVLVVRSVKSLAGR